PDLRRHDDDARSRLRTRCVDHRLRRKRRDRRAVVTGVVMDGAKLRENTVAALRAEIEAAGTPPVCLATVLVGDDKPSQIYVRSKQKKAAEAGMQSRHIPVDAT